MVAVEDLIAQVQGRSDRPARFDLWVPDDLTFRRQPVNSGIAMATLGDAILGEGFEPDGFAPGDCARTYRYRPFDSREPS